MEEGHKTAAGSQELVSHHERDGLRDPLVVNGTYKSGEEAAPCLSSLRN